MGEPDISSVNITPQLLGNRPDGPGVKRQKRGDKWFVTSADGTDLSGPHDTEEDATQHQRKADVYKRFYDAHVGLHLAYDAGHADDQLLKSIGPKADALDLVVAHRQLVDLGNTLGVGHEDDSASLLDALSSPVPPGMPTATGELRKAIAATKSESRYTLGPLYIPGILDAHNEWTDGDNLQKAIWQLSQSGDTNVYLQHHPEIVAGQRVELVSWPYPVDAALSIPDPTVQKAEEYFAKRDFSTKRRKHLASTGAAMADGSFPIENQGDLDNAAGLVGNSHHSPEAVKAHIRSRAKALGLSLPESYSKAVTPVTKSVRLPAHTVFQGTLWEPWAWGLVKKGKLRGLSMGGYAKRRKRAPMVSADFGPEAATVAKSATDLLPPPIWFRVA